MPKYRYRNQGFIGGKTVSDIITAIEGIPAADNSGILAVLNRMDTKLGQVITGLSSVETAIKNIPATDTTGILAALGRIET